MLFSQVRFIAKFDCFCIVFKDGLFSEFCGCFKVRNFYRQLQSEDIRYPTHGNIKVRSINNTSLNSLSEIHELRLQNVNRLFIGNSIGNKFDQLKNTV